MEHRTTRYLDRERSLREIRDTHIWDIAIIGGGATGLGIALDAASRGYKTLLLEQADFSKGTSSRSTKLVHGGVRYLAQGNIKLVYEALRERGIIFRNAPHVAHVQSFVIPCYSFLSKIKFLVGLKLYDWMGGRHRIGKSSFISNRRLVERLSGIVDEGLKGGIEYFDGQFDDARLAVNISQTATEYGATLLNYAQVVKLSKDVSGNISGVEFVDEETGEAHEIKAKATVNATGVFVDDILSMDNLDHVPMVRPSQGVHLVVSRSFLGGSSALMIPKTSDGRVLFGVPWHEHLLLGTTDTPLDVHALEPRALDSEVDFILKTAGQYLVRKPKLSDVLSVFAGLRPLAAPRDGTESTKEISRDHKLVLSESQLITITGGKWTTYRKMAEDAVDTAMRIGRLPKKNCQTFDLRIHGYSLEKDDSYLSIYGCDAKAIRELAAEKESLAERLHPVHPHIAAEVIWAARYEMARTVEDVLARRIRILFLDARAAIEMAPKVAALLQKEFHKDEKWASEQVRAFSELAEGYLIKAMPVPI
ncbi:glycerol-3-phosphate dehydrogenase/oxidase [Olivibacter sitiensis]|uniref:glycerol-3-phosphate dehydrogenase/oxidase n=1 Tax=Olivibacter sitiensis TaxID=376470 RepID=UPI0009FBED83|nr:glycerol-3-phosphate dehydrogenase/oxidase [Olivibacter sitiensis]